MSHTSVLPAPSPIVRSRGAAGRAAGLVAGVVALSVVGLLSIALGARSVPIGTVLDALWHGGGSGDAVVIRELRLPRTLLGLGVGAALGLSGALMQSLTRNPLADPGILGISEGAAAGVVVAIGLLGITSPQLYVWFAFAGAALATVVVYVLGSRGRSGATPVRLALAGVAVGAALHAGTAAVLRVDTQVFDRLRFWLTGSLTGQDAGTAALLAPFFVLGAVLALSLGRALNTLALGDDASRALGAHLGRTRVLTAIAITLLCGAATAGAGPIWFLGLAVPHAVRALVGPDQRWVLPYSLVLAPTVLLAADVLGRLVVRPGELGVGIVSALIGAPIFIALARRSRIAQL